ncbi:hypothetical protein [Myroides pelagicus]|uniref:Uncharacterized protein n=1 Tax=Myroides pelagicus TaxID=270914 RepID=A0A7K1GPB2_9FLAO|nr:hypothetical protein [Myroides pelagicus]MTH30243.1 hypothetical protein [Myroides pelagicus]
MQQKIVSTKVLSKYKAYLFSFRNRTVYLILQLLFYAFILWSYWYGRTADTDYLRWNVSQDITQLTNVFFICWLLVILFKFIIHFAALIPGLSYLMDRLEQREMDKIKNTLAYQITQNDRY